MLELRVARLSHVHMINTAALLRNLKALDVVDDAVDILDEINRLRISPMAPIERPAKSTKIRSTLRNAVK